MQASTDVVTPVMAGESGEEFSGDLARGLDQDEGVQTGLFVSVLQPTDIMHDGHAAGFNTSVIALDRFIDSDRRIGEIIGPRTHEMARSSPLESNHRYAFAVDERQIRPIRNPGIWSAKCAS